MPDYLFYQRQRRTNQPAWAWDFRNRQPELYGAQVPTTVLNDLGMANQSHGTPWKRWDARFLRTANSAYEIKSFQVELYGMQVPPTVQNDLGMLNQSHSIPWRRWDTRFRRAAYTAYDIDPFQVEIYGGQVPISVDQLYSVDGYAEHRKLRGRTANTAYQIPTNPVDLYAGVAAEPDELATGRKFFSFPAFRRRAVPDAYDISAFQPDLYDSDFLGRHRHLEATPRPLRRAADAYGIRPWPVELYGGAPQEVGELFPDRPPKVRRATADQYDIAGFSPDLYGPTGAAMPEELQRFLLPEIARATRRTAPGAYGIWAQPPDFFPPLATGGPNMEFRLTRRLRRRM